MLFPNVSSESRGSSSDELRSAGGPPVSVEPLETGEEEGSEEGASQPSGKRQRFRLDRDTEVEVTSSVEEGRERRAQKEQGASGRWII